MDIYFNYILLNYICICTCVRVCMCVPILTGVYVDKYIDMCGYRGHTSDINIFIVDTTDECVV